MTRKKIVPVILCGGSGTRLWPASRENHPKQFLSLINDRSLLQNTVERAMRISGADASSIVVVTLGVMEDAVIRDLSKIDPRATNHILCEPSARNTSAAIAFAADYVASTFGVDAIMWILPSDHHIADETAMAKAFSHALPSVQDSNIVTFGITPTRPDTGYGYIKIDKPDKMGDVHWVSEFIEKPDLDTARLYFESGDYLWNSGMFVFTVETVIRQFKTFAHDILMGVRRAVETDSKNPDMDFYENIESIPFDKSIVENSTNVTVVPCNPEWSDIGSWESLWEIREKDENGNVLNGRAACYNSTSCFVHSKNRLIATSGIDDLVIVETEDAILVARKSDTESIKTLVQKLKEEGMQEVIDIPEKSAGKAWSMVKTIAANELLAEERPYSGRESKKILDKKSVKA